MVQIFFLFLFGSTLGVENLPHLANTLLDLNRRFGRIFNLQILLQIGQALPNLHPGIDCICQNILVQRLSREALNGQGHWWM